MVSGFGWAALALLFGYLALFFWGSAVAAQAAGRPVWLFARATGRDQLAAFVSPPQRPHHRVTEQICP